MYVVRGTSVFTLIIFSLIPLTSQFCSEISWFMNATVITPEKRTYVLDHILNYQSWISPDFYFEHQVRMNDTWTVCYRMRVAHVVTDFEDPEIVLLQNEAFQRMLETSDVVVGPYSKAMVSYAAGLDKLYFINEPVPLQKELEGLERNAISLWSSKSLYIDSVSRNLDLLLAKITTKQRILLLVYEKCQTEHAILFQEFLGKSIKNDQRIVEVFEIKSILDSVNASLAKCPSRQHDCGFQDNYFVVRREVFDRIRPLREKVLASDINLLYFGCQGVLEKLEIMDLIFHEICGFDMVSATWMFVDSDFIYQKDSGIRSASIFSFQEIILVQDFVYFYKVATFPLADFQDPYFECIYAYTGLAIAGVREFRKLFQLVMSSAKEISADGFFDNLHTFIHMGETDRKRLVFKRFPYSIETKMYGDQKMVPKNALIIRNQCGTMRSYYSTTQNVQYYRDLVLKVVENEGTAAGVHGGFMTEETVIPMSDNGTWDVPSQASTTNDYVIAGLPEVKEPLPVVLVIPEMPYVRIRQDGKSYEGLAMDIIESVIIEFYKRKIFLEFEYQERSVYGLKENNTWNGIFAELNDPKSRAVLAIGMIVKTPDRLSDFDFTQTLGSSYLTYVAKKRSYDRMFQFLFPFAKETWIALSCTMVLVAFAFMFLQSWNPLGDEIPDDHKITFLEGIWHAFTMISMAGAPSGMVTIPNRLFSIFVWFFSLVVIATYCGNLVSFLTQNISYLDELKPNDLVLKNYDFGSLPQSSVQEFHRNKSGGHMEAFHNRFNNLSPIRDYTEGISKVVNDDYVFFGLSMPLYYQELNTPDCSVKMLAKSTEDRVTQEFGFPLRKDWIHAQAFKEALFDLEEQGILPELHSKWMDFSRVCVPVVDSSLPQIGWEASFGLLAILGVSIAAAFLCLFVKLAYLKCRGLGEEAELAAGSDDAKVNNADEKVEKNGGADNPVVENTRF